MRIAVASWSRRKVGGAETYLDAVLPALLNAGHDLAYVSEVDAPSERAPIAIPAAIPVWCFADDGLQVLQRLREWRPDLIFSHALDDAALETALIAGRKGIFYSHNYYGACLTGTKTHSFPQAHPCTRRFGAGCLALFYPRRCGGLNPVFAWKLYLREKRYREVLRHYSLIVTASEHMRREYINQGIDPKYVRTISSVIAPASGSVALAEADAIALALRKFNVDRIRLLFLGRMVDLKGGAELLEALPQVALSLRRPVHLTFVGDGPARSAWTRRAASLHARFGQIAVEFAGWASPDDIAAVAAESHLLVMPSLWPEPFGRAGLEVGQWGVPSVAFATGGIPEWLLDGVNGHLASGDPATAHGLAEAIVRALSDRDHYARLCAKACARVKDYRVTSHVARLSKLFDEVAGS